MFCIDKTLSFLEADIEDIEELPDTFILPFNSIFPPVYVVAEMLDIDKLLVDNDVMTAFVVVLFVA